MSLKKGLNIIDEALNLAIFDLSVGACLEMKPKSHC